LRSVNSPNPLKLHATRAFGDNFNHPGGAVVTCSPCYMLERVGSTAVRTGSYTAMTVPAIVCQVFHPFEQSRYWTCPAETMGSAQCRKGGSKKGGGGNETKRGRSRAPRLNVAIVRRQRRRLVGLRGGRARGGQFGTAGVSCRPRAPDGPKPRVVLWSRPRAAGDIRMVCAFRLDS